MSDIKRFIHKHEPVSRSEVREQFGLEGVKTLASLLDDNEIFEGKDGEYWSVGTDTEGSS